MSERNTTVFDVNQNVHHTFTAATAHCNEY